MSEAGSNSTNDFEVMGVGLGLESSGGGLSVDLDLDNLSVGEPSPSGEDLDSDQDWVILLEHELDQGCDFGKIRKIAENRPLTTKLRAKAWQVLLGVANRGDPFGEWDGLYDLKEQALIRKECQVIADLQSNQFCLTGGLVSEAEIAETWGTSEKLGNPESDKVFVTSDLETALTLYCKTREMSYESGNGWSDILQLLLALKLPKHQLYNTFFSFSTKYIPRGCVKDGKPFDLFRLLLLYHEPKLCSILDTHKVSPDLYAKQWFNSLFAASCTLEVALRMWDVYLQQADPFLVFFLALVMLINAKEVIVEELKEGKEKAIEAIKSFPEQIAAEDIDDFCQLAGHFSAKTPQSFRRDYHGPLYGSNLAEAFENVTVHSLLCLPISVQELLQPNRFTQEGVQYFVVDCRPLSQYNHGHLPGAFHLDASMIVNKPDEFHLAVQSLGAFKQKTHPEDHFCFMGSGREEEDQYLHMLISSFLQKEHEYVSLVRGGYAALHEVLREALSSRLKSHSVKGCLVCNPPQPPPPPSAEPPATPTTPDSPVSTSFWLKRMTASVKNKSSELKGKVVDYIVNAQPEEDEIRHVNSADRHGKRYRNMPSVFSIGDDSDDDEDRADSSEIAARKPPEEPKEKVKLDKWLSQQSDIFAHFECSQVEDKQYLCPGHLAITRTHLFVLRECEDTKERGWYYIKARRPLANIHKITSKKRIPEVLTFKYGFEWSPGQHKITGSDCFHIPKAGDCAKAMKTAIVSLQGLDLTEAPPTPTSLPATPSGNGTAVNDSVPEPSSPTEAGDS